MNFFQQIYSVCRQNLFAYNSFLKTKNEQKDCFFKFYNFWKDENYNDIWLSRFLREKKLIEQSNKNISFYSVYGFRQVIEFDKSDVKVFYTGENLKYRANLPYSDAFLNDKRINLSLGFEYFQDKRYIRFPLWIFYLFKPNSTYSDIFNICNDINNRSINNRSRFASLVASWDPSGIRTQMIKEISSISDICCPGKWNHNDDTLKKDYNDNKIDYLKDFKFNLCPENSDAYGYVTEKLFQAISAGCIPVYWGSNNQPELGILNQDAILFWNYEGSNTSVINQILELNSNEKLFKEFASQPRFTKEAPEIIYNMFEQLENKLKRLL